MRAIVMYESMYGNTHEIADAIGEGLRLFAETDVRSIHDVSGAQLDGVDMVVIGGPTHAHGMSRESTRQTAVTAAGDPESDLAVDPDAAGDGVREWLEALGQGSGLAAAFDTRVDMPAVFTGRASKGIAKQLRKHGFDLAVEPESFLVTKDNHLEPEERERARAWGEALGVAKGPA